jgi:hypothetical protein
MARRLRWSPRALDDLDDILAYIAKDSPFYARRSRPLFSSASLPDQPDDAVRIVTIVHSAGLLKSVPPI